LTVRYFAFVIFWIKHRFGSRLGLPFFLECLHVLCVTETFPWYPFLSPSLRSCARAKQSTCLHSTLVFWMHSPRHVPISRLPRINIKKDYNKMLRSSKMLTGWARDVGFTPTHSEKHGRSPEYVFHMSSRTVSPTGHGLIWKLAAPDMNWATEHVSYWLVPYPRPRPKR
jgi:hypothetical protein